MNQLQQSSRFQNYAGVVVVLALILGGGTTQHLWTDHLIKLAMLPYALNGFYNINRNRFGTSAKLFIWFTLIVLAAQFIPVGLKTNLPSFTGVSPDWQFITTSPYNTIDAVGTTLCLLGFGLNLATRPELEQKRMIRFIVFGLIFNMLISLIQLSFSSEQKIEGILPFTIWVGVFANENHFTTLLFIMIPLLAWQLISVSARPMIYLLMCVPLLVILYAVGSRAGTAISTVLVLFCYFWFAIIKRHEKIGIAVLFMTIVVLVAAAYQFDLYDVWIADGRGRYFENTWVAFKDNWVTGTGLGSFVSIYPMYERTEDIFGAYVNHAHNDFIELLLELGIVFAPLLIFYLVLLFSNFYRSPFTQAASLSILAMMLHSTVEYPLRSMAISMIFVVLSVIVISGEKNEDLLGARAEN